MNEQAQLESAASDRDRKPRFSISVTTFIAVSSFVISIYNFYVTSIKQTEALIVSQDGFGDYVSMKKDDLKISTKYFSHVNFANAGNRNLVIDEVSLVVFQPGATDYSSYPLEQYTQAADPMNPSTNRFDNQRCVGDMSVIRLDIPPFTVKGGEIEIKNFSLGAGLEVHEQIKPPQVASLNGEDGRPRSVAALALTEQNRTQTARFVYCITIRLRNADGKTFPLTRPMWSAEFKLVSDSDLLEPGPFNWLPGLDQKVFERTSFRLLD